MNTVSPVWFIAAAAAMSLVPVALGLATSYVKVSVVLSMIRNALGTQQVPGTLVIMALSFSLTVFIMGPILDQTLARAAGLNMPAVLSSAPGKQLLPKLEEMAEPWRTFLQAHTKPHELEALVSIEARRFPPEDSKRLSADAFRSPPLRILLPAFVLSELREAFTMGFLVLLPFLVIDLIVANILAGMGMFMVSPVLISLPVKLLIFVLSDAWLVIVRGLILSYG